MNERLGMNYLTGNAEKASVSVDFKTNLMVSIIISSYLHIFYVLKSFCPVKHLYQGITYW